MALDPTVRAAFPRWVARWEGVEHALYLDGHKPPLVTTAIGLNESFDNVWIEK